MSQSSGIAMKTKKRAAMQAPAWLLSEEVS
jgi:hypothetical protein